MFPRIIWFMWLQGEEAMPPICAMCLRSWRQLNPEYELRFLSENNLHDYLDEIDLNALNPHISIQERANCIRMMLLERYGGVWADATAYCNAPLEAWLPQAVEEPGFFAYSFQQADRPMGNWFMAAKDDSYIVRAFNARFLAFWQKNRKLKLVDEPYKLKIKRLKAGRLFNRMPWLWNSFVMIRLFRRYHYFMFHYMFGQLIHKDKQFAALWDKAPKRSSYEAHELLRQGLDSVLTAETKALVDDTDRKVFKLTWKEKVAGDREDTIYAYLSKKIENHG